MAEALQGNFCIYRTLIWPAPQAGRRLLDERPGLQLELLTINHSIFMNVSVSTAVATTLRCIQQVFFFVILLIEGWAVLDRDNVISF
jgi:hypothetical protein